jgi:hypothetical protein
LLAVGALGPSPSSLPVADRKCPLQAEATRSIVSTASRSTSSRNRWLTLRSIDTYGRPIHRYGLSFIGYEGGCQCDGRAASGIRS